MRATRWHLQCFVRGDLSNRQDWVSSDMACLLHFLYPLNLLSFNLRLTEHGIINRDLPIRYLVASSSHTSCLYEAFPVVNVYS